MSLFNFSLLPNSLKYSIVDLFHKNETKELLKVNIGMRALILKRGFFPKHIEEISISCPESEETIQEMDPILRVYILYANFHRKHMENSLTEGVFVKDFDAKSFWKLISQIKLCRKLHFNVWPGITERNRSAIEQMRLLMAFSKLQHFQLFQLESTMGFSELILEMVRPKTIDKLEVYVPKEGANGEEVESFYTKLFSTSGFSTAKDVYFGCELMDYWKIASKLRCQHAGLSIDEPEKLMNTFKDILRKGLPNQHEKASIQLHGNLGFAQQSTEVFSNFVETVAEVSGIKIIKPDDLDSVEVEALKKLAFHATNRYTYENLHTLQISRPELKRIYRLEQTVTERSGEKFFTLNFDGNEYILMICVEDLRSELWPSVKVSLVFMPRTIP